MSYFDWENSRPIDLKSKAKVYLYYAPEQGGGKIKVYRAERSAGDIDYGTQNDRVAFMDWAPRKIQYLEVHEDWQRQGIGRAMWKVAREKSPDLQHDFDHMTHEGWLLAEAVDPDGVATWSWDETTGEAVKKIS